MLLAKNSTPRNSQEPRPSTAAWYAVTLTRRNAKWAFSRGEPYRTIASLELCAVLMAVKVLVPLEHVHPQLKKMRQQM